MDEDLARILVVGGTIASRELTRLYDLLRLHLPEANELRLGVASALAEVGLRVIEPAFDAYPELRIEVERQLEKYSAT